MKRQEIITIKANLLAINKSCLKWLIRKSHKLGERTPLVFMAWKKSNDFAIEFDKLTEMPIGKEIGSQIFKASLLAEPTKGKPMSFAEMGEKMAEIKKLIRFNGQHLMVAWKYQYEMESDFFYDVYIPMVRAIMVLAECERKGK